jgi:hypothetical protein
VLVQLPHLEPAVGAACKQAQFSQLQAAAATPLPASRPWQQPKMMRGQGCFMAASMHVQSILLTNIGHKHANDGHGLEPLPSRSGVLAAGCPGKPDWLHNGFGTRPAGRAREARWEPPLGLCPAQSAGCRANSGAFGGARHATRLSTFANSSVISHQLLAGCRRRSAAPAARHLAWTNYQSPRYCKGAPPSPLEKRRRHS